MADRWQPADFFYREREELLGYLGYYIFHPGVMDVVTMVAPKARRRGIFQSLWRELLWLTQRFSIKTYRFPCDPKALPMKSWLTKQGAVYLHTEYHMMRKNYAGFPVKVAALTLERVDKTFIPQLAQMDVECFHSEYERSFSRYTENFTTTYRQAWMVKLGDEYIGKIHLRFDANTVFLHDICILPALQGRGYGGEALRRMATQLSAEKYRQLSLDVETKNKNALNLYLNCGFTIAEAYEYHQWQPAAKLASS